MKHKNLIIGIIIIAIVLIFIIPPPAPLMDFLLMLSIAVALIIILNALYAREALEMSFFPTLLLIVTLFQVALNISSTRLILGTGYAGEVIMTFGSFVGGKNIVVGAIVFAIITIINFMVITKGSERVAEVTARFTLDAMPGKQMAIDADLNTGLINDVEAKARRKKIQDEANFYGAMDGASKFVKGNAVAGILVVFINSIGGIALGATGIATGQPLSLADAAQLYTTLTIGDGLVSQIPALLISVATGLIVTKATNESDIGSTLTDQLFGQPLVIYICGGVLALLGLFTPLPWYFFIPFGLFLIFCANQISRRQRIREIDEEMRSEEEQAEEVRKPENVVSLLNVDPILLLLGYGLIPLVDAAQGGDLLDRFVMIRRQIAIELGVIVPVIRLRDNIKLNPNQYRILIKGVEVAEGEILFDHYMAMNPGYVEEEIDGIETVEPYMGLPALWITEAQRERAEALGYTVVDPPAIIATHLTEIVRSHLHELLTRQDVQTLIDNLKETNSIIVDELVPKLMSVGEIQKVLANLLREGISIRDLLTILETLANHAQATRDTDMLTEYVRQALRRAISKHYLNNEVNSVITLDPQLEQQIMENIQQTEQGSYLALDPKTTQSVYDNLSTQMGKLTAMGLQPIILASPVVRIYFKRLVEQVAPDLVVLSYNELEPSAEVQSIGMVGAG